MFPLWEKIGTLLLDIVELCHVENYCWNRFLMLHLAFATLKMKFQKVIQYMKAFQQILLVFLTIFNVIYNKLKRRNMLFIKHDNTTEISSYVKPYQHNVMQITTIIFNFYNSNIYLLQQQLPGRKKSTISSIETWQQQPIGMSSKFYNFYNNFTEKMDMTHLYR